MCTEKKGITYCSEWDSANFYKLTFAVLPFTVWISLSSNRSQHFAQPNFLWLMTAVAAINTRRSQPADYEIYTRAPKKPYTTYHVLEGQHGVAGFEYVRVQQHLQRDRAAGRGGARPTFGPDRCRTFHGRGVAHGHCSFRGTVHCRWTERRDRLGPAAPFTTSCDRLYTSRIVVARVLNGQRSKRRKILSAKKFKFKWFEII